jgi:hypothetical protein
MNIPDCSSIASIHNKYNTCWNLVAQTILFYNVDTRDKIFAKLFNPEYTYYDYAKLLVENASDAIKYLLPDYFGPDYFEEIREDSIQMFSILFERYDAKYSNQFLDEYSDEPPEKVSEFKRSTSNMCENNFTQYFFNIFKLDDHINDIKFFESEEEYELYQLKDKDYTSTIYETFFLLNMLSVVLLNDSKPTLYYFEDQNITFPSIERKSLGSIIWVKNHVVGIFKCDDTTYKYVDNDFITTFNFEEFLCSFDRAKHIEDYKLMYNPYDGIYIHTINGNSYFSSKNDARSDEARKISEVFYIYNVYEYIGSIQDFKQSNDWIKSIYSIKERLIIDIEKNNVEGVRALARYLDGTYTNKLFTDAMNQNRFEIVKILIEHMNNYDDATEFICKYYNNSSIFAELLNLIIQKSKEEKIEITNIDRLLIEYKKSQPTAYKILLKYKNIHIAPSTSNVVRRNAFEGVQRNAYNDAWGGGYHKKYLKYVGSEAPNLDDIFYKKYIMYKQKYLNLKNKLSHL